MHAGRRRVPLLFRHREFAGAKPIETKKTWYAPPMSGRSLHVSLTRARALTRVMWALGMLLLLAQWGAQAHAYSHDRAPASALVKHTNDSCAECPNFAPLLAGAASSHMALTAALPCCCVPRDDGAPLPHDSFLVLAFRSRAPPAAR